MGRGDWGGDIDLRREGQWKVCEVKHGCAIGFGGQKCIFWLEAWRNHEHAPYRKKAWGCQAEQASGCGQVIGLCPKMV